MARKIIPWAVIEKRAIAHALKVTKNDMMKAAKALGIGKTTLYRKCREYGW